MLVFKLCLLIVLVSLMCFACVHRAQVSKFDQYYFAVLDAQVESEKTHEYHTMDRIYDLSENSNNADLLLLELLDYRLGAAGAESLMELITEKGKGMLPLLRQQRAKPLDCLPKYKSICLHDAESRNRLIDAMVDAIEKGIVIHTEEPTEK
jgi:hypothetical protein